MLILFICVVTPCTEGESTLEPCWGPFRLSLKCFLGSIGALQQRGIRDPGLSVGEVFPPLWFWLLVGIALCL
ncbi:hypothetical protein BJ878DRAFT_509276 [Calycina marina]|uniref:Uncharacterized protein n=1 Tax=Calycina marina TaxID=1763456 RepID=A0A9P7Z1R7_9HELO|nr:hypothetical protein BJ878DRAFT_509276 [Calycina marina]